MSTLNYIGSKKSLLDFIDYVIGEIIDDKFDDTNKVKFLDGFAGSGIVGKFFNQKYDFNIYSNDLEYYSFVISYSLLKVPYSNKLENIINQLNLLTKPIKSDKFNLITENYSEKGKEKRMFWTIPNAEKADAIMENILDSIDKKIITKDEYFFLLASLLSSFDKVANTASVYGAFLKKYKSASLKSLIIKPIHTDINIVNSDINQVFNNDVNSNTITNSKYDIVYLDPPYNSRQYSSNYHPLNFIAKYDDNIIPYGKTGLIEKSNKSKYSIKKSVSDSFTNLIDNLDTKFIMVSYNDEGLMDSDTIVKILESKGKVSLYKYEYKKFKSQLTQISDTVFEYLYLCEVGKKGEFKTFIITD
jgi:adenine-specific DNA-methyltransferase